MSDDYPVILDLSCNDLGTVDPKELLSLGVKGVALGVYDPNNPPHAMANLGDLCVRNGLPVVWTYGLTYFGDQFAVERDCRWAIDLAREFKVSRVFMDAEIDACDAGWQVPRPLAARRIRELHDVESLIEDAGLAPGVYAGGPFWVSRMLNTQEFANLPLWFAAYGPYDYPAPAIRSVAFGGFKTVFAHQFTSLWGAVPPYSMTAPRGGRGARDASYLFEEDTFMPGDHDNLEALMRVVGGWLITVPATDTTPGQRLTGWDAIHWADVNGNSLYEGHRLLQAAVAADEAHQEAAMAELRGWIAQQQNRA